MVTSVYKNIEEFFNKKSRKISRLRYRPIIMKWLESPSMKKSLQIIDKKVGYLLEHYQSGGEHKLIDWFLTGDQNFVSQTAERYIIDYLRFQNVNIVDNLKKEGIDATLKIDDQNIGIEITTLNGSFAEWILTERLSEILNLQNFLGDKSLRIEYDYERIRNEMQQNTIVQYLISLGEAIISKNYDRLRTLDVSIEIVLEHFGIISWNSTTTNESPWLKYLTDDLFNKVSDDNKKNQLMKFERNIVFIGVNHVAPGNWAIPSIFDAIGNEGNFYGRQIDSIKEFWEQKMIEFNSIIGVCFFNISIDQESPFYPLKIFWRTGKDIIPINL